MPSNTKTRVVFCDDMTEPEEDLGFIRHRLKALAYSRAVCGLRTKDQLEYQRLCERERTILEAFHQFVTR